MWQCTFFEPEVVPFDLKMHAIFGVDKPRSVAVQCCVGHQAQIDKQTKLFACDKFGQIHVRPAPTAIVFIFMFTPKEPFDLSPHVFVIKPRLTGSGGTNQHVLSPVKNLAQNTQTALKCHHRFG